MKNPFRKPTTIFRKSEGRREGIHWLPGPEVEQTILAHVQPLNARELTEVRVEKGGRLLKGFVKIYTENKLISSEPSEREGEGVQPDIIIHNGERYVIVGEGVYNGFGASPVTHNKYIAALEIQHAEDSENA